MAFRGETTSTPAPIDQPDSPSRRRLLIGLGATGIATATHELWLPERREIILPAATTGLNINYLSFGENRLPPKETLEKELAFSGKIVRVGLHPSIIFGAGTEPDFTYTDAILQECIKAKKRIVIVSGTKTTDEKEFNLPYWYWDEFPELTAEGAVIGTTDEQSAPLLFMAKSIAQHYGRKSEFGEHIIAWQQMNEGLSKKLTVTTQNIDPLHYDKEIDEVMPYLDGVPLIQNYPLDTPENGPKALTTADILGLCVYPQTWEHNTPFNQTIQDVTYWPQIEDVFQKGREVKKPIWILEQQIAKWTHPKKAFDENQVKADLQKVQDLHPDVHILWDMEQKLARALYHGETEPVDFLYNAVR